jgi:serine/threonine-protein kinase
VFDDYSASRPKGKVAGQVPRETASVPSGSEVVVLVSRGPSQVQQGVVALPDTIGMAAADAVAKLQAAGLSPEVANEYSQTVPEGVVMDQLPNSSDFEAPPVKKKTSPWLWVAILVAVVIVAAGAIWLIRGTQASQVHTVAVPDVVGLSQQAATTKLEEIGLRANPRTNEDASVKPDTVTAQSPTAGSEVATDTRVDIIVAVAPQAQAPTQVSVPNVVGKTQSDAEAALQSAGLKTVVVENPSDTVAKGSVITQLPTGGTLVTPGAQVSIMVSSGPPKSATTISVPDVVGKTTADAETALRDAGLKVQSIAVSGTSEKVGYVFDQAPDAGESVPEGSTVTVLYAQ